ncbi:MAG: SRPBCC family protein [Cucumibacter sp.]
MAKITLNEHFATPPARAFAVLTDFASLPKIVSGIDKVEVLTVGPVGVGTRFRETRSLYGRMATEEMEVTAWEPPCSFTLEAHSHGAHYVITHALTPKGGGADVELAFATKALTPVARILSFLMQGMTKGVGELMRKDLLEAKAHAEKTA